MMGSSVDRLADLKDEAHTDNATTSVGAMKNGAEDSADPTILAEPGFKDHENDHGHRGTRDQYEEVLHHYDNHQNGKDHIKEPGKPPAAPCSSMPVDPSPKDELKMSANCQTPGGADTKRADSAPPAIDLESQEPKLVIERFRTAQAVTSPALKAKRHTSISTPQPETTGSAPEKAPEDIAAVIPAPANAVEEDSDEPTILSVRKVTPELKRKASNISNSGPMKKRFKQHKTSETEDEEASPVSKRKVSDMSSTGSAEQRVTQAEPTPTDVLLMSPPPKRPVVRQSIAIQKTTLSGQNKPSSKAEALIEESSKSEGSDEEDQSENEKNDQEEDPKAAQERARANKSLAEACRKCRTNVSRALKLAHEENMRQLKKQSKDELRAAKERGDRNLNTFKEKSYRDKCALKEKYEDQLNATKANMNGKIGDLRAGHSQALESWQERFDETKDKLRKGQIQANKEWQEKYDEMKQKLEEKNRKLTKERDDAETNRKAVEKTVSAQLRSVTNDQKASELKLKEERKQMMRDCQEQIDQIRPEHSLILKAKQKNIEELAKKVVQLESELKESHEDLREARTDSHANELLYHQFKDKAETAREQIEVVEENLRDFEEYVTKVEERSQSHIARVLEDSQQKIDLERANLQQTNNRLVEQQRRNQNLNETLMIQTQSGREMNARIQALESELAATKAEIGVANDIEGISDPQTSGAWS